MAGICIFVVKNLVLKYPKIKVIKSSSYKKILIRNIIHNLIFPNPS